MPQFGIRTIMLLIAVTAVWTAYYTGRNSIERDLVTIEALHALIPELHIRNQNEYACLQMDSTDVTHEYQCYLPPGYRYKLHLHLSKEFNHFDKAMQPRISAWLPSGTHQISLNELPDRLAVSVDGVEVLNAPKKRLASRVSSSTGVSELYKSQWYPLDQPLVLLQLRESDSGQLQSGGGPGIALWIEMSY